MVIIYPTQNQENRIKETVFKMHLSVNLAKH